MTEGSINKEYSILGKNFDGLIGALNHFDPLLLLNKNISPNLMFGSLSMISVAFFLSKRPRYMLIFGIFFEVMIAISIYRISVVAAVADGRRCCVCTSFFHTYYTNHFSKRPRGCKEQAMAAAGRPPGKLLSTTHENDDISDEEYMEVDANLVKSQLADLHKEFGKGIHKRTN